MKKKDRDDLFRERFGVEPFTDEEISELKAILYSCGSSPFVNGNVNMYARYHKYAEAKYQEQERMKSEDEYWEEMASFAL